MRVSSLERTIGMMEHGVVSPAKVKYSAVVRTGNTSGSTSGTSSGTTSGSTPLTTPGIISETASGVISLTTSNGAANQKLCTSDEGKSNKTSMPKVPVKQAKRDMRRTTTDVLPVANLRPVESSIVVSKDTISDREWKEVTRRRSRGLPAGVMRGTAAPGGTQLEACERRRFLHLFYLKLGTTEAQVRSHLAKICGSDVCVVEALKARGKYASFKLDVPLKLGDKIMLPENWAEDICIKPWTQNFRARTEEGKESKKN